MVELMKGGRRLTGLFIGRPALIGGSVALIAHQAFIARLVGGQLALWVAVGALGSLVFSAAALIGERALARTPHYRNPAAGGLAIVFGATLGSATVVVLQPGPRTALSGSAVYTAAGLTIIVALVAFALASIASRRLHHRSEMDRWTSLRASLDKRLAQGESELERARGDLRRTLADELKPTIAIVRTALAHLETTDSSDLPAASRLALREHANSVIRPLSQAVIEQSPTKRNSPRTSTGYGPGAGTSGRALAVTCTQDSFAIGPALIVTIAMAIVAFLRLPPQPAGATTMLLGIGVLAAASWPAYRAWLWGTGNTHNNAARWLSLVVAFTALGAIGTAALLAGQQMLGASYVPTASFVIVMPIVGTIIAVYRAYGSALSAQEAGIRRVTDALAVLDAEVRRSLWFEQKRLAALLHNDVQARLLAIGARIEGDERRDDRRALAADIHACLEAIESLMTPPTTDLDNPGETLAQVFELWSDLVDFNQVIDQEEFENLDTSTSSAAVDIIREAILNAVRHGGAAHICVTVQSTESSVRVRVEDDGLGPPTDPAPGLGSQFLNDMCSRWQLLASQTGGAVLMAELPTRLTAHTRSPVDHS